MISMRLTGVVIITPCDYIAPFSWKLSALTVSFTFIFPTALEGRRQHNHLSSSEGEANVFAQGQSETEAWRDYIPGTPVQTAHPLEMGKQIQHPGLKDQRMKHPFSQPSYAL